ncbi:unnamed protein product [Orchesella dallaii]|uniref:Uncharacterized protein n=1 Tax=Orchesella dallaii TaxID=48710 RepID=A0ABP1PTX3_9HEXA
MKFVIGKFLIVALLIVGTLSLPVDKEGLYISMGNQSTKAGDLQIKDLLLDFPLPLRTQVIKHMQNTSPVMGTLDKQSIIAGGIQHKGPLLYIPWPLSEKVRQEYKKQIAQMKVVEKEEQIIATLDQQLAISGGIYNIDDGLLDLLSHHTTGSMRKESGSLISDMDPTGRNKQIS